MESLNVTVPTSGKVLSGTFRVFCSNLLTRYLMSAGYADTTGCARMDGSPAIVPKAPYLLYSIASQTSMRWRFVKVQLWGRVLPVLLRVDIGGTRELSV